MQEDFYKLKNVQIYPAKNFKVAIDNLTRKMFEMCIDSKDEISFELVESRTKKIKSYIKIFNYGSLKIKFTEFEYAIFNSVISERIAENECTTAAILCRHLGSYRTPGIKLQQAVIDSLEKLACIRIVANLDGTQKFYTSPIGDFEFRGYFLPSESRKMSVNGQPSKVIHFLSKGPVFAIADMKDQIITCPQELMQAPVKATIRSISINHYLLRRISEMKGSLEASKTNKRVKPLRHTILLDSLYKACDITGKRAKQQSREIADIVLKFFVEQNFINNFSYESEECGKIRSVFIDFQLFSASILPFYKA